MRLYRLTVCALVLAAALPRAGAQVPGGPGPAAGPPAAGPATAGPANSGAAPTPPAAESPLFPTSRPVFDIPFQIDEPIPGEEPVEVQLHTSEDRGVTWKLYGKVAPADGRFTFRAERDGEYWFLVRTLNRVGKLLPDRPPAPELRVLVDTVPPQIELSCSRTTSGEISARWQTADPQLKLETLELSYQGVDDGLQWRRVVVSPSQPGPNGEWIGQATFSPRDARAPHYVRVEVSDGAGNRAAAQQQISTSGETAPNPSALPITKTPDAPPPRSPAPFASQSNAPYDDRAATPPRAQDATGGRPWPAVAAPMASPVPPPREAIGPPRSDGSPVGPNVLRQGPPTMSPTFPGGERLAPWGENVPPRKTPPTYSPASSPGRNSGADRSTAKTPAANSPISGEPESLPAPEPLPNGAESSARPSAISGGPTAGPLNGPTAGSISGPVAGPAFAAPSADAGAPAILGPTGDGSFAPAPAGGGYSYEAAAPPTGVRPRLVNSRKFELDYDVESVGPSGVAKVELWATSDGGKSWKSYGADPDSTSPYVVNVEGEGTFGFRMVIESTTGLRSPQPQPGDLPEIWIGVDVTKPTARITAAIPGTGEHVGELIIEWAAEDATLAARPIGLAFADRLDGPWTTIASGVPNQGSYAWRLDNRAPERLYLKLDVRDEAGNVGTFVTPEAVSLTRVKPQGKIRGVRPIGESARLRLPAEIAPR